MWRIARLCIFVVPALVAGSAAAGTKVTLQGDGGEVCRFRAGDAREPFRRWFTPQDAACVPSGSTIDWPSGLWNVFGRSEGMISLQPILVDASLPPESLMISMVPSATLRVQFAEGETGVVYAPKRVVAFPASARTIVPAGEELWLFVLAKSQPLSVLPIPAIAAGSERAVDAREGTPAAVGWIRLPNEDREALERSRGVSTPDVRATSMGIEASAGSLPAPAALDGAMVLLRGLPPGSAEVRLGGRGWIPSRRSFEAGRQPVTLIREPLEARAAAMLIVNWSTANDLVALDRSVGSCEPPSPPRFDLVVSSCPPPRPGEESESAACQPIRTEPLPVADTFGTVTIGEVPPGQYRVELRFGKLPAVAVTTRLGPLQMEPIRLQAFYSALYGNLTRGGQALGETANLEFPRDGRGFLEAGADEYHAVVAGLIGPEAKIGVGTCRGERAVVLTDRPVPRNSRFDIDIPDNVLTVTVIDTFTRMPIDAKLQYRVMSLRVPRIPVLTGVASSRDEQGRFVMKSVPDREIRLEASSRGYKRQDAAPFTMPKSGTKEIEIQLVPLSGVEGKITSSHPFEAGTIFWTSANGVETERSELAPDGSFFLEQTHAQSETMTVVSRSHAIWIAHAPAVQRATPLEVRFPDAAPVRGAEVYIPALSEPAATLVGVTIGGLRVPAAALVQHLAFRNLPPVVRGGGPLRIPAMVQYGSIQILRGPTMRYPLLPAMVLRDFAPIAIKTLEQGTDRVVFEGK